MFSGQRVLISFKQTHAGYKNRSEKREGKNQAKALKLNATITIYIFLQQV